MRPRRAHRHPQQEKKKKDMSDQGEKDRSLDGNGRDGVRPELPLEMRRLNLRCLEGLPQRKKIARKKWIPGLGGAEFRARRRRGDGRRCLAGDTAGRGNRSGPEGELASLEGEEFAVVRVFLVPPGKEDILTGSPVADRRGGRR
ncbi:MAG TPA: hypothetical protein VKE50_10260, partial [Thermoanaerobaculia bacterium]|nr:hypothetical protein [Thermoanaerobaculia bacterium]